VDEDEHARPPNASFGESQRAALDGFGFVREVEGLLRHGRSIMNASFTVPLGSEQGGRSRQHRPLESRIALAEVQIALVELQIALVELQIALFALPRAVSELPRALFALPKALSELQIALSELPKALSVLPRALDARLKRF
jgi:hypothetical protein